MNSTNNLRVGGMSYILQTILVVGGINSTNNVSSRGYVIYPTNNLSSRGYVIYPTNNLSSRGYVIYPEQS
jgi:hypothetical protein